MQHTNCWSMANLFARNCVPPLAIGGSSAKSETRWCHPCPWVKGSAGGSSSLSFTENVYGWPSACDLTRAFVPGVRLTQSWGIDHNVVIWTCCLRWKKFCKVNVFLLWDWESYWWFSVVALFYWLTPWLIQMPRWPWHSSKDCKISGHQAHLVSSCPWFNAGGENLQADL